jgi:hypothetical protein
MDLAEALFVEPQPIRRAVLLAMRYMRLGSYERRVHFGAVDRPSYAYCVYNGALLGKRLGYQRVSVIEFGVAGGAGLTALERHAAEAERRLSIGIEVYGFDTGEGLPPPIDYRDIPYHWKPGFFRMDQDKLRQRLTRSKLVLGDIRETSETFFALCNPAPIAAVMHDFDYYTSTVAALKMFESDESYRLPRVHNYFDDIVGSEIAPCSEYTGERLAIREFNDSHEQMKLSAAHHLLARRRVEPWYNQIYILDDFAHSRYNDFVSDPDQQLPLR